jgi:catechol 2,3-dioxygenase
MSSAEKRLFSMSKRLKEESAVQGSGRGQRSSFDESPCFLPDETFVGQVRLRTRDIKPLLGFYHEVLGLPIVQAPRGETGLSGQEHQPPFIVLAQDLTATSRSSNATGLFHTAIRYPTRVALARACLRLLKARYPLEGASDHGVSEAIYLSDPDGNGIELYADRPRSQWIWQDGQVAMETQALDLDGLLCVTEDSSSRSEPPAHPNLGHIHLRVSNLSDAERFFHKFLGLAVTQRTYPGALFFAAGGYHHHIATNIWGHPLPARPDSVGLISYRLQVPMGEILYCLKNRAPLMGYAAQTEQQPNGNELLRLRDPNGNWLELEQSLNEPFSR